MFLRSIEIKDDSFVTDIVAKDYRTSSVFIKYGIEYCCGGRMPLEKACEINGANIELVKKELDEATRNILLTNGIGFEDWTVDFLIEYVRNVHHAYLNKNLTQVSDILEKFAEGHQKKHTWIKDLVNNFRTLQDVMLPHLEEEEQVIFPYIRQIAHAYENREPYAALLVRTMRKPIENMMTQEHEHVAHYIKRCRELTQNYTPPPAACISHKVCFSKLRELDDDLVQHSYLENNFIFPRAIAIEKELLRGS